MCVQKLWTNPKLEYLVGIDTCFYCIIIVSSYSLFFYKAFFVSLLAKWLEIFSYNRFNKSIINFQNYLLIFISEIPRKSTII